MNEVLIMVIAFFSIAQFLTFLIVLSLFLYHFPYFYNSFVYGFTDAQADRQATFSVTMGLIHETLDTVVELDARNKKRYDSLHAHVRAFPHDGTVCVLSGAKQCTDDPCKLK